MELTGLDQLWVADITYIRLQTEFVYLAVVLDAFSRRVAMDRHLEDDLTIEALQMALRRSSEMSSGRLFLDGVLASRAHLRFTDFISLNLLPLRRK